MALIMAACAVVSLQRRRAVSAALKPLDSDPRREPLGFAAMLAGRHRLLDRPARR